jgi:hypothetical protein
VPKPTPAAPPWTLDLPTGGQPGTIEQFRQSVVQIGQYSIDNAAPPWLVRRIAEPSPYLIDLPWRMTGAGLIGGLAGLDQQVASWPAATIGNPAEGAAALHALRERPKPNSPTELLGAFDQAGMIINSATPERFGEYASGVARVLLAWYPAGLMIAWGKSSRYVTQGRPAHMLAGAALNGWGAVEEGLASNRGGVWVRGEDIDAVHTGALALNLISSTGVPGIAIETLPVIFIFEFGANLSLQPPLDFLSIRYLHSLPVIDYMPATVPAAHGVVELGLLEQGAVRAWFLQGFNRLADHLIRWENFMTRSGSLRPVTLQATNMTVARILKVTTHLLASEERGAQFADFWDLVDLYASLHANDIPRIFGRKFWEGRVLPALATLPGNLGPLFVDYARDLYEEWVEESIAGIVTPSRVAAGAVRVTFDSGDRNLTPDDFFARHIYVRRNTLHGYDLLDAVNRAFLSIHDGSLPLRLPEWGRLMAIALLADPTELIERRFLPD